MHSALQLWADPVLLRSRLSSGIVPRKSDLNVWAEPILGLESRLLNFQEAPGAQKLASAFEPLSVLPGQTFDFRSVCEHRSNLTATLLNIRPANDDADPRRSPLPPRSGSLNSKGVPQRTPISAASTTPERWCESRPASCMSRRSQTRSPYETLSAASRMRTPSRRHSRCHTKSPAVDDLDHDSDCDYLEMFSKSPTPHPEADPAKTKAVSRADLARAAQSRQRAEHDVKRAERRARLRAAQVVRATARSKEKAGALPLQADEASKGRTGVAVVRKWTSKMKDALTSKHLNDVSRLGRDLDVSERIKMDASMRKLDRRQMRVEGQRLAMVMRARDRKRIKEHFHEYDQDGRGLLSYDQLLMLLEDCDLLPRARGEKVVFRRLLMKFASAPGTSTDDLGRAKEVCDGLPPAVCDDLDPKARDDLMSELAVGARRLPQLLAGIRSGFQDARWGIDCDNFAAHEGKDEKTLPCSNVVEMLSAANLLSAKDAVPDDVDNLFFGWLVRLLSFNQVESSQEVVSSLQAFTYKGPIAMSKKYEHVYEAIRLDRCLDEKAIQMAEADPRKVVLSNFASHPLDVDAYAVMADFLRNARSVFVAAKGQDILDRFDFSGRMPGHLRVDIPRILSVFSRFDTNGCERIDATSAYLALLALGFVPLRDLSRVDIVRLIKEHCDASADERTDGGPAPASRQASGGEPVIRQTSPLPADSKESPYWPRIFDFVLPGERAPSHDGLGFRGFVRVILAIRTLLRDNLHKELKTVFQESLGRPSLAEAPKTLSLSQGFSSSTMACRQRICIRDIWMALAKIRLAPENALERQVIGELFDESDHWGLEPPTLDYRGFVILVQRILERKCSSSFQKEWAKPLQDGFHPDDVMTILKL